MFVTIVKQNRLDKKFHSQLVLIEEQAEEDPFLKSDARIVEDCKSKSIILWRNEKVIGFYIPETVKCKGFLYPSLAAVYLDPDYRGLGIMGEVMKNHLTDLSKRKHIVKQMFIWIEEANSKSLALFSKLGFDKEVMQIHLDKVGHWYVHQLTA